MPSFWSWEELQDLASEEGMNVINFDQRPMGHCRKKPTSILTNLPNMLELQELRSPTGQDEPLADNLSERIEQSRSWALWAPGFRAAVWASLKIYMAKLLQQAPRIAKALTGREKRNYGPNISDKDTHLSDVTVAYASNKWGHSDHTEEGRKDKL